VDSPEDKLRVQRQGLSLCRPEFHVCRALRCWIRRQTGIGQVLWSHKGSESCLEFPCPDRSGWGINQSPGKVALHTTDEIVIWRVDAFTAIFSVKLWHKRQDE
jgi:hypothetical protein